MTIRGFADFTTQFLLFQAFPNAMRRKFSKRRKLIAPASRRLKSRGLSFQSFKASCSERLVIRSQKPDLFRMALGASDGSVASMVVRQGLLLALIGLGAGLLGALAVGRIFSGLPFEVRWLLLFEVRPTDPLIPGIVSVLLTIVALLACFLPARGAARVDPMVALRYE